MPLLHSAGAGLSLAAAGTTVLIGASAMVAFNGWPGMRENVSTVPVRLAAAPPALRENGENSSRRPAAVRLRSVPVRSSRSRPLTRTSSVVPARGGVAGISVDAPRKTVRTARRPAAAPRPPAQTPPPETRSVDPIAQAVGDVAKPVATVVAPVRTVVEDAIGTAVGSLAPSDAP